jgi:peptidoglycan/xylan/chitin deacetylase (PgdA/CDA1 family)
MKALVKDLVKKSLYALGYYRIYGAIRTSKEPRLLVLMYHDILDDARVSDPTELDDQSPSAREFEAHLRVLTSHYSVLPLREAVERLHRGELDRNSVAITFDDGYEAVFSVAFPFLKRYNVPATVFLLTDWIDNQKPYWWHRVRGLIQRSHFTGVTRAKLESILQTSCDTYGESPVGLSTRRLLAHSIERSFRDLTDEERDERLAVLERTLSPAADGEPPPEGALTWDQVREMSAHGVDFEPHTCSHINIRHENRERIQREIECSRRAVEQQTGRKVAGFAYPYGKDLAAYAAIEGILREQGFAYAITAVNGVNSRETHPYLLLREGLPRTTSGALLHRSLILAFARPREGGHLPT